MEHRRVACHHPAGATFDALIAAEFVEQLRHLHAHLGLTCGVTPIPNKDQCFLWVLEG